MPWCTIDEAAADAEVSVRTIQRWISAGTVPTKKEAGRTLIDLPAAFGGPGLPVDVACETFDFDHDGDVDLSDLVAFQAAFTGTQ